MTTKAKGSESGNTPGLFPTEPAPPARTSPIAPQPPGSGELDGENRLPPVHPMQAPVRSPVLPTTQATLDEDEEEVEDEDEFAVPEPVTGVMSGPPTPSPALYSDGSPVEPGLFLPAIPDASEEVRQQRAPDDPIYQVCARCGLPYGTFQRDPYTGTLVHRFLSECLKNAQNAHPFVEGAVPARVELPS